VPGYLPLCAFRQGLLPTACRSCAWWQTTGSGYGTSEAAAAKRHLWMTTLEGNWGSTGLLLEDGGAPAPAIVASINFAPAAAVPRLRKLPFGPLPAGSTLLFCLRLEEGQAQHQAKRLLHKALRHLKDRDVEEVYAVAGYSGGTLDGNRCEFFSFDFLSANGFEQVMRNGQLFLMRADLRGLLSLIEQLEAAARRVLRIEPAPTPAAWTRRETP
jgi:hypothetical protein